MTADEASDVQLCEVLADLVKPSDLGGSPDLARARFGAAIRPLVEGAPHAIAGVLRDLIDVYRPFEDDPDLSWSDFSLRADPAQVERGATAARALKRWMEQHCTVELAALRGEPLPPPPTISASSVQATQVGGAQRTADTGPAWRSLTDSAVGMALTDDEVIVVMDEEVVCLEADTGRQRWRSQLDARWDDWASITVTHGIAWISGPWNETIALDVSTGSRFDLAEAVPRDSGDDATGPTAGFEFANRTLTYDGRAVYVTSHQDAPGAAILGHRILINDHEVGVVELTRHGDLLSITPALKHEYPALAFHVCGNRAATVMVDGTLVVFERSESPHDR